MNKLILGFLALMTISAVVAVPKGSCPIIKCDNGADTEGTCASATKNSNGSGLTYSFSKCKKNWTCNGGVAVFATGTTLNYSCQDNSAWDKIKDVFGDIKDSVKDLINGTDLPVRLHEDKCDKNGQCLNGTCSSSKCNGKDDGSVCATDGNCKVGSACVSLKCTKQKKEDESCLLENECENNLTCAAGKCVKYNSKDNGFETINAHACKSGQVGFVNLKSVCDEVTVSKNNCSGDNDECSHKTASSGYELDVGCTCTGYSSSQDRTCVAPANNKDVKTYSGVHTNYRYTDKPNWDQKVTVDVNADNLAKYGTCVSEVLHVSSGFISVGIMFIFAIFALMF